MKTIINLGKVDYNKTGRKINLVTIEVKIKEEQREGKLTIDLFPVEKYKVFSMSANVWNNRQTDIIAGGQMCDQLPELFPNNKDIKRLVEIWKRWHLNNLKSGTAKQVEALNNWNERPKAWSYTEDCNYLKSINLYEDNGYKYGSSWLVELLPESVEAEVNQIISRLQK